MSEPVTHLILGATGQIGSALTHFLNVDGAVALSRAEADFERPETVVAAVRQYRPAIIWNAAGATRVDQLEDQTDRAFLVNAETPGLLAREAELSEATLVHFSTDYVFDGTKFGPYVEEDIPRPLNVYGRSKLAGEEAIQCSKARFLILRTSWVYNATGRNFLRSMVERGLSHDTLRVVDDQIGAPTWSSAIAQACNSLMPLLSRKAFRPGIYHLTASGQTSWYGFAEAIRRGLVDRGHPWRARVTPISTVEFGSPAPRPANSVLSNSKAASVLGVRLAEWTVGLESVLDELTHRTGGTRT